MKNNTANHFKSINELLKNTTNEIEALYFSGTSTELTDLDDRIFSLHPSELVIISGSSSMVTSLFAINIVEYLAINTGIGVAVFSMNLSAESIIFRMMSSQGKININKLCSGQLKEDEWPRLTGAVFKLNETHIFIDEAAGLSPNEIQNRVMDLNRNYPIGLIVIDSLQLMQLKRQSEILPHNILTISKKIRAMAKYLNIPVIALSDIHS